MIDQAQIFKDSKLGAGTILTYTGTFSPLDPKVEDVNPIDIAHALGNQVRYTGHGKFFYSVAEHCVILHDYLARTCSDSRLLKTMLNHDDDEAYMIDLAAPLKHHPNGFGKDFIKAAQRIQSVVAERFDLITPEPPIVKELDVQLRTNEMNALFPGRARNDWGEPLDVHIYGWTPTEAKAQFMWRLQNHGLVFRDEKGDFQPNELVLA